MSKKEPQTELQRIQSALVDAGYHEAYIAMVGHRPINIYSKMGSKLPLLIFFDRLYRPVEEFSVGEFLRNVEVKEHGGDV